MTRGVPALQRKLYRELGLPGPSGSNRSRTTQRQPGRRPARPLPEPAASHSAVSRKRKRYQTDHHKGTDRNLSGVPSVSGDEGPVPTTKRQPSIAARQKAARDDVEIRALEKKLGIKEGRKSLPRAFHDDGLDELLEGLQDDEEEEDLDDSGAYDDWLRSKRDSRGAGTAHDVPMGEDDEDDQNYDEEATADFGSNGDSFGGFETEAENEPEPRKRENPYVPPVSTDGAKYVPPPRRRLQEAGAEGNSQLRRQLQGLVNRLTEDTVLSIVKNIDGIYQNNPRGVVTAELVELLMSQVCKPEPLPDQFFVLTGGFAASVYKIVGVSFGSHLLTTAAAAFREHHDEALKSQDGNTSWNKEAANILSFITELYIFEVSSHQLIFDYVRLLLEHLCEANAELLLRLIRLAGRMLRRDDGRALSDAVADLNREVSRKGVDTLSLRTRFMVESINQLKSNRAKATGQNSAIVSEHAVRMKKRIGELKSESWRRLDGMAPMGMGLKELESAETAGSWWLVGSSVAPKRDVGLGLKENDSRNLGDEGSGREFSGKLEEELDLFLPDYPKKAHAQGLTTPAQVSIFTAIMSAVNADHAYRQYLGLRLRADERREIAKVLVQCAGSETPYNRYYAVVAKQACSSNKIRFAFQDCLWRIFRLLGESMFDEEDADDETATNQYSSDERRLSSVGKLYGSLLADGSLSVAILRPVDLPNISKTASLLIEWILASALRKCSKLPSAGRQIALDQMFRHGIEDHPALAAGLHYFMRRIVKHSSLVPEKESKRMAVVTKAALRALEGEIVAKGGGTS